MMEGLLLVLFPPTLLMALLHVNYQLIIWMAAVLLNNNNIFTSEERETDFLVSVHQMFSSLL